MRLQTFFLCLLASPLAAQDRDGNDTPGEWKVTHHQPFGLWDSMCDERRTGATLERRCYLRYVDVFSPHPNFGAIFAFITPDNALELGIERGTRFKTDGLRAMQGESTSWTMPRRPCLSGGTCRVNGADGAALLETLSQSDRLIFEFVDRHGAAQVRDWDLSRFGDALTDHRARAAERGL